MLAQKKKSPNEYPLIAFRASEEQKVRLNKTIEDVRKSLNKKRTPDAKMWMKNDVIIEALELGLPLLKKNSGDKG